MIIFATGYNITFAFFDPSFLVAPDVLHLYRLIFRPGIDVLLMVGSARRCPRCSFVECQVRVVAAYLSGT